MVGNAGAVDVGKAIAPEAVVITAVGAFLQLGILGGDALAGGQADIAGIGPGGIVIVVPFVVCGAVGVNHHKGAFLQGLGNVVHGGVRQGIPVRGCSASDLIEIPPGLQIHGRIIVEAGILVGSGTVPVGLNQGNFLALRIPALGRHGSSGGFFGRQLHLLSGRGFSGLHPGRITAGPLNDLTI